MKNQETFEESQEKFVTQLVIVVVIILMAIWLIDSIQWEAKVMSVHYCFQEQTDGSLYHYVCEK